MQYNFKVGLKIKTLLALILICLGANAQQKTRLLAEKTFQGILDEKDADIINVLVIHGTGIKPYSYADKFVAHSLNKVNFSRADTTYIFGKKYDSITVRKISGTFENNRKIAFYIVHWSYYTEKEKKETKLLEKEVNKNRAPISTLIKNKVLIEQLYDFVVFSNITFKSKIKKALNAAFDDMLNCGLNKKTALNLVSGSLGSSVFIEYVNMLTSTEIAIENGFTTFETQNFQRKFDYVISSKPKFFMLTNQVNFLESIIAQKIDIKKNLLTKTMQVVAFRHTNDVLCFYLTSERASQFINFMPADVTNVRYKNFPFANNIMAAHEKPFQLKKLYNAILYGSDKKKTKVKIKK